MTKGAIPSLGDAPFIMIKRKGRRSHMRVEQQNTILEALQKNQKNETEGKIPVADNKETASVTYTEGKRNVSVSIQDPTYLNPAKEDEKKSVVDGLEKNAQMDALDRKNQMAVLAHTTSEEDYEKMQEEGFSLNATTGHAIVTVTDKIKMQLAKAGVDISIFGDDLSMEQLKDLTGSTALATQLEQVLKEADLPADEENIESTVEALVQAATLTPMNDGSIKYMLDNELEPTIENIYKAEFCGSTNYDTRMPETVDISEFSDQIEKIIESAGLSVNDETLKDSQWLITNQLPLTKENLTYLEELRNLTLPVDLNKVLNSIVTAITEGNTARDAMLLEGHSLIDQAVHTADVVEGATEEDLSYLVNNGMELTVENIEAAAAFRGKEATFTDKQDAQNTVSENLNQDINLLTARRQLEEVRLAMTVEANYSLLKQGISIDTEPLVKLIDELKNLENQYYANLLQAQGADASAENISLFAETTQKLQEMQAVPAYVLGIPQADATTINGIHEAGTALKTAMERASQTYESLLTQPTEELGDSIQKAFQNISDILAEIGMEDTDANERAARILGYNNLEITPESVLKMKAADLEVQRTFQNMTPAVVTELIKRKINPLEMDLTELNQMTDALKEEVGKDSNERFSEYLWKLEKNDSISSEERSTYIGMYRLIHQVTESDGAVIGALVNQGAEITLKNLLTAVRTSHRTSKMDVTVNDSFGELEKVNVQGETILDQIMAAYQTNCILGAGEYLTPGKLQTVMTEQPEWENMTPEAFAEALSQAEESNPEVEQEYAKEQLQILNQCAESSEEVYRILQEYDIPNTPGNITALEVMMNDRNRLFRKIFGNGNNDEVTVEDLEDIKKQLLERFGEAVSEPEALASAQETLGEVAENVMKTMIESDKVTSIDVREARLMQAQLSMNSLLAKKEQYSVPVLVGDEVTNVSLKIVRGVDTKGIVDIMLESELSGKIAATFQAKEEGISGLIATNKQGTRELFAEQMGTIADAIGDSEDEAIDLRIAYVEDLDLNHFSGVTVSKNMKSAASQLEAGSKASAATAENESESYKVQTTRLYHIAEAFIRTVKELA